MTFSSSLKKGHDHRDFWHHRAKIKVGWGPRPVRPKIAVKSWSPGSRYKIWRLKSMAHALKTPFYSFPKVSCGRSICVSGLSHRRRRHPLYGGRICARQIPSLPEFLRIFSNTPIDLYGRRGGGWQNPAPPLDSRLTKSMLFLNWWPAAGFCLPQGKRMPGLKGPTATPAPKHATIQTRELMSVIAGAADPSAGFRRPDEAACQQAPYRAACQRLA